MEKDKVWTVEEIKSKIENNQIWLERAILAIFDKQTNEEQKTDESIEHNGVGFNKPDSYKLSYYAKWIKSGKHLSGWHLQNAKIKMAKYSRQLTDIANGRI